MIRNVKFDSKSKKNPGISYVLNPFSSGLIKGARFTLSNEYLVMKDTIILKAKWTTPSPVCSKSPVLQIVTITAPFPFDWLATK